jgi:ribosomal protein S18 acetylase RimI-like enzyme
VTAADLLALAGSDHPEAGVFVAVAGDEAIGAGIVDRAPPALIARVQAEAAAAGHPLPDLPARRVGHLRTGAVHPSFRRQGVGAALIDARLARLRDAGCTAVIALAWLSGDRDNSQGLLRAHDLEPVAVIPDYWRTDPPGTGTPCAVCGPDCRCRAAVYVALW